MYFKVNKGTPLFDSLMAVYEKIKKSRTMVKELEKEVGADGSSSDNHYLAGRINAFHFKNYKSPGENWMSMQGKFSPWYMPRSSKKFAKENKELFDKLAAIPRVDTKLLMEPLGLTGLQAYSANGSLVVFSRPRLEWYPEYVILTFPDEITYSPVDGMEEILGSVYKELKKVTPLEF